MTATTASPKRTTVVLDQQDQEDLEYLKSEQRVSEMEALRRSIRLARQLLEWQRSDGEIILRKGETSRGVVFL